MTETEWDTTDDPTQILAALGDHASERKLRLFGLFCCRQALDMCADPVLHAVLDAAERHADSQLSESDRSLAESEALDAYERELECEDEFHFPTMGVVRLVAKATYVADDAASLANYVPVFARYGARASFHGLVEDLQAEQCLFLRDLFRNPFRPAAFSSQWRTDTAVSLARTMYDARDFSAMPILADALQDAGCDNDDILSHCRDTSLTHVRGCGVVDLVLGKS
jgi:hypothetical protein